MLNKKSYKRIKSKSNKSPNRIVRTNRNNLRKLSLSYNKYKSQDKINIYKHHKHLRIVKTKDNKESNRISKNKTSQNPKSKIYKSSLVE